MPKDVYEAMHELEFTFMLPRLEAEVAKFTSIQADKRNTYRKKVREGKKAQLGDQPADGDSSMLSNSGIGGAGGDDGSPRAAKRAKMDGDVSDEDGDETIDVEGEGEGEDDEVEDDEIEEDEDDTQGDGLVEDPLEEKEKEDEDDEMADGDESD